MVMLEQRDGADSKSVQRNFMKTGQADHPGGFANPAKAAAAFAVIEPP